MRILIDQDQVLCCWVERILEWYNEDKHTSFTRDDIKKWDMTENLGDQADDFIRSCMRYPEFYRDLAPVEGAIYGMERLIRDEYDVLVVTAVPKCAGIAFHGKHEWLRRNIPSFDLNNFFACHRKYLVDGDVLFDDGLHNIKPFVMSGPRRHAVVMDTPWNRDTGILFSDDRRFGRSLTAEEMGRVYRVTHWNGFLELIPQIRSRLDRTL